MIDAGWLAAGAMLGLGYGCWARRQFAGTGGPDRSRAFSAALAGLVVRQSALFAVLWLLWKGAHAAMQPLLIGFLLAWTLSRAHWIRQAGSATSCSTGVPPVGKSSVKE